MKRRRLDLSFRELLKADKMGEGYLMVINNINIIDHV